MLDYVTRVVSAPELKPVVKEMCHYITVYRKCGGLVWAHAPRKRSSNAVVYDTIVKT